MAIICNLVLGGSRTINFGMPTHETENLAISQSRTVADLIIQLDIIPRRRIRCWQLSQSRLRGTKFNFANT
jgi:hypothetical protein